MDFSYVQSIPNAHFWTNLTQIINLYEFSPEELTKKFLTIGFNNTMKNGYELKHFMNVHSDKINNPIFRNISEIIEYVNSDLYNPKTFYIMLNSTLNAGINIDGNNEKLTRLEVYQRIDGERDYQDVRWNSNLRADQIPDEEKSVAEWLNYIEYHLNKAKVANYHLNKTASLDELRKVAALVVRALEIHGCPKREISFETTNKIDSTKLNEKCCGNCNCKK